MNLRSTHRKRKPNEKVKYLIKLFWHPSGLKQVTDYDYAASTAGDATGSPVSRKPISKDDRSPWSEPKHRRNKKSGGGPNRKNNNNNKKRSGTKQEKQLDKRKAAVMRTARRAEAFDNINDDTAIDSTAAGQQNLNQLLGLGKPRPLLPPASQLKPFVSVGVCSQKETKKKKKRLCALLFSHISHTHTSRGGRWVSSLNEKLGP